MQQIENRSELDQPTPLLTFVDIHRRVPSHFEPPFAADQKGTEHKMKTVNKQKKVILLLERSKLPVRWPQ